MGRKDYMQDLATAQYLDVNGIDNVHSNEDGEFTFTFTSNAGISGSITAMVPELSEYPKSHEYMLFASDDAPAPIAKAVQDPPSTRKKTIPQLLVALSKHLESATATGGQDDPFEIDDDGDIRFTGTSDAEAGFEDADDFDDEGDNEDWAIDEYSGATHITSRKDQSGGTSMRNGAPTDRIRGDLLTAKAAGFKVGSQGPLTAGNACYVSISCQIAKLGISEEAMQAWSLEPHQYLCLVLYYPDGYKDFQTLTGMDSFQARHELEMRVGVSDFYKPRSLADAQHFFKPDSKTRDRVSEASEGHVKETFISRPLNNLLNDRLLRIINARMSGNATSWSGAEKYYNDSMGAQSSDRSKRARKDYDIDEAPRSAYPRMVVDDELTNVKAVSQISFPLVAMQFLLRHFVRCTEFCLVCHTRIASELEAIKPYVCENPLCLFQYMNLGFGPSMEHEILAQPFVVDVLVSFCYASVVSARIREYPEGLGLSVPHPSALITGRKDQVNPYYGYHGEQHQSAPDPSRVGRLHNFYARLNRKENQLLFDTKANPLKRGDWIAINPKDSDTWHCRVTDTMMFPTVSLEPNGPVLRKVNPADSNAAKKSKKENDKPGPSKDEWERVEFTIYNENFDDLSKSQKATTMLLLLDLLPSVREMKTYLLANPGSTIAGWTARLPPASVGLLRWVIASNRACIMQADEEKVEQPDPSTLAMQPKKGEQRIPGMTAMLQFRFAMGAPDKEQRFLDSLSQGNSTYPSLFAWHGSPLANWHSIIREGLNFKETLHGRAYGNGCYHAPNLNTSQGYAGMGNMQVNAWPSSILKINTAIALNEIVNKPEKYQSASPHYVVQYVDWIQTRYLFVTPMEKISVEDNTSTEDAEFLPQDPHRLAWGPQGTLKIPMTAVPRSRRPDIVAAKVQEASGATQSKPKKGSKARGSLTTATLNLFNKAKGTVAGPIDLDTASVSTLDEDRALLTEPPPVVKPPTPPPSVPAMRVTSYKPGKVEGIQMMPPPTYATPNSTMAVQRAFRDASKTQAKHIKDGTLAELAWYLDVDRIEESDNLYQWVIQMHSFPLDLQLGKDMEKTGIDAITFEMRFSANYPYAPPFLRVIRPRFLPFNMGGGGHVTLGGSVCMDLLTSSGWSAVYSIESILLQVRMALMSTDPKPARLNCVASGQHYKGNGGEYGVAEAVDAFRRACQAHGWEVPLELQQMTQNGSHR